MTLRLLFDILVSTSTRRATRSSRVVYRSRSPRRPLWGTPMESMHASCLRCCSAVAWSRGSRGWPTPGSRPSCLPRNRAYRWGLRPPPANSLKRHGRRIPMACDHASIHEEEPNEYRKTVDLPQMTIWHIDEPPVTAHDVSIPEITFKPGDIISVTAGGGAQT